MSFLQYFFIYRTLCCCNSARSFQGIFSVFNHLTQVDKSHFTNCLSALSPFVYVNGCQKRTLAARRTPTPLLLLLVLLGSIQYFATLYKKVLKKNWYNFSLVLKRCSSMYVGASASISDESRYYTTHVLEQPSKNGLSTTQFRIFFNIENLDSCCAPQ